MVLFFGSVFFGGGLFCFVFFLLFRTAAEACGSSQGGG